MTSHAGLCNNCAHRKDIRNDRGSIFILCRRGLTNSSWPKYPRLPVLRCGGFEPRPVNIILAAIEGVLVTSASRPLAEPAAIQALNCLCTETGARLVVTPTAAETPHILAGWGVQPEVFGSATIEAWIAKQPGPPPVDSFVILDAASDDSTPNRRIFSTRLIRTNAETGLTMADAQRARQMLMLPSQPGYLEEADWVS